MVTHNNWTESTPHGQCLCLCLCDVTDSIKRRRPLLLSLSLSSFSLYTRCGVFLNKKAALLPQKTWRSPHPLVLHIGDPDNLWESPEGSSTRPGVRVGRRGRASGDAQAEAATAYPCLRSASPATPELGGPRHAAATCGSSARLRSPAPCDQHDFAWPGATRPGPARQPQLR